ncbi:NitT/TauT family transport system permease protein [Paenibacillus sp. cl141a]|uniref:ABC transporter permease n=1 Tax=Paenibacillus TaxID=44249 RepID=UPI0008B4E609|nr:MULTISPECIES: ABC transporter permease [Paenibacillus]PCL94248.1 ABC transporter permease [Paenibacillus lautus]QOT07867.1 ABC transporter permease [Paenibacillus sp. JNUCC-32]WFB60352.1 ABC transporter permease [Paenibacillus sp. BR1-192]SEM14839.1 NitT/TauT family transport system permease protein [Paenibacillus sp. cl141a]GIP01734.1 putative ABC transporter permease protein YtlD [Paenibacillus lautus]
METARKEAFIVHAVTPAESAAGSSKRPEVVPYILDEEGLERRRSRRIVWGRAAVAVLVFLVWEVFTRIGLLDSYYWSSPSAILRTTWTQITEGTLLRDITYTSGSTILGFVFGTFLGALLGLSFWWSKSYAGISEPYLIILNAMPKLALAPVLVILLGIGFFSKVALAFSMTVVVSALSAYSGVKSVDPDMEKLMYSLGAKRHQVFTKVVVPWSMPWIISSLRINIALALAGAIVGEFIASSQGVGRMIMYAGTILDINLVWVGVVVLSLLSMVMYWGVVVLEKWLSKGLTKQ